MATGPAVATAAETLGNVSVTAAQVERMDIKVVQVQPAKQRPVALLPGTVVPALNARIVAAAAFGGTVLQVKVLPGQMVAKGAPLAVISSRELLDAKSQLAQARAELQMADALARRKRSLADKNIQNPTIAEEAEAQVAKIRAVIEQNERTLEIGGITIGEAGTYTIAAPAAGRVVSTNAMPGDKVDAMTAAVTIDTSNELWIEGQVPADLVPRIKIGDAIQVVDGPGGKVVAIGNVLDRLTRSATLYASVPANSGLIPGQMVTLGISQEAEIGSLAVPSSAVARIKNRDGVFVRNSAGFRLVPVMVRGRSPHSATVAGEVPHDAQVATSGLPQLEQMLAQ
ncbi:MAG: efflux RND transporter periplasmic adaptor subunit [Hyphomicrobium sp.]